MTPELEALAREAVACPRWRWMVGMRAWNWIRFEADTDPQSVDGSIPDLSEPATVGGLLALVRVAHNRPRIVIVPGLNAQMDGAAWYVQDNPPDAASGYEPTLRRNGTFSAMSASPEVHAPSEPAALVAALRAAP